MAIYILCLFIIISIFLSCNCLCTNTPPCVILVKNSKPNPNSRQFQTDPNFRQLGRVWRPVPPGRSWCSSQQIQGGKPPILELWSAHREHKQLEIKICICLRGKGEKAWLSLEGMSGALQGEQSQVWAVFAPLSSQAPQNCLVCSYKNTPCARETGRA